MLFNAEKRMNPDMIRKGASCITYSIDGWPIRSKADIEGIIGEKPEFECQISVYRMFCHDVKLNPRKWLSQQNVQIKLSNLPQFNVNNN
jgi:hypothetical protein